MSIEFRQVGVIAAKEFWDRMRSRWVFAVAVVFTALALAIAYFGSAPQGGVGFKGADVTIASLVSLVIYLVPLISLILGFDAIVGERERGSLDLLLSMPITRLELLLGKFSGLSAALAFSTLAGFGLVGLLLSYRLDLNGLYRYFQFTFSAILMGMAFLSIAIAISVVVSDRARASGVAIAVWFFFVLIYDLVLLGILVGSGGRIGGDAFPFLLLLNPADVFRILNIFGLAGMKTLFGLATVFPPALAEPWVLGSVMVLWIAAPLAIAAWRFK